MKRYVAIVVLTMVPTIRAMEVPKNNESLESLEKSISLTEKALLLKNCLDLNNTLKNLNAAMVKKDPSLVQKITNECKDFIASMSGKTIRCAFLYIIIHNLLYARSPWYQYLIGSGVREITIKDVAHTLLYFFIPVNSLDPKVLEPVANATTHYFIPNLDLD